MRKFLRNQQLMYAEFPDGLEYLRQPLDNASKPKGTLLEMATNCKYYERMLACERGIPSNVSFEKTPTVPLPPVKRTAMNNSDNPCLKQMYERLYPADSIRHVSTFIDSFSHLLYAGNHFRASSDCDHGASTITAQWFDNSKRPAIIRRFFLSDIVVHNENGKAQRITHTLAEVEWYKKHPQVNWYSSPLQVWGTQL